MARITLSGTRLRLQHGAGPDARLDTAIHLTFGLKPRHHEAYTAGLNEARCLFPSPEPLWELEYKINLGHSIAIPSSGPPRVYRAGIGVGLVAPIAWFKAEHAATPQHALLLALLDAWQASGGWHVPE